MPTNPTQTTTTVFYEEISKQQPSHTNTRTKRKGPTLQETIGEGLRDAMQSLSGLFESNQVVPFTNLKSIVNIRPETMNKLQGLRIVSTHTDRGVPEVSLSVATLILFIERYPREYRNARAIRRLLKKIKAIKRDI